MERNNIMKNIHILPTDKPSRLIYNDVNQLCYQSNKSYKNDRKWMHRKKFNIYITSNEEIKEGNWVLGDYPDNPIGKVIAKYGKEYTVQCLNGNKCGLAQYDAKKIILTTDQNLIKNGVQAIDDTFLKWFVNNPSCDSVKIDLIPINEFGSEITVGGYGFDKFKYKIIIPQKEPKLETLEEAANKLFGSLKTGIGAERRAIWMNGAKFQQEQDKKKFSEEEVLVKLYECLGHFAYQHNIVINGNEIDKWFEQFKKK